MTTIYQQHDAAFAQVAAYVLLDAKGEQVGKVALKFPRDGAGRLYAYFHLHGVAMVRAYAGGYGYDKRSAAVASAIAKIPAMDNGAEAARLREGGHNAAAMQEEMRAVAFNEKRANLQASARDMDSSDWQRVLERLGYRVLQAV